jgi:hypothetical protein
LAEESRLPNWIKLPVPYSRTDVAMEIITYLDTNRFIVHVPADKERVIYDEYVVCHMHPDTALRAEHAGKDSIHPYCEVCAVGDVTDTVVFDEDAIVHMRDDPDCKRTG